MKKEVTLDEQISKLETFLKGREVKQPMFDKYMDEAINIIPYDLPALLYPARMGLDLYEDALDYNRDSTLKQIAACAVVSPIAIPLMTLTVTLSAPFVVSAVPVSAVLGGIQSAQAIAYNNRTEKAERKLAELKEKRAELSNKTKHSSNR